MAEEEPTASDGPPVADLHLHTTASDGTLTVSALPAAARRGGVAWLAVTDHDRIHPELGAPLVRREGVRIIRGIELRVETSEQRLDLLGYGVEATTELTAELDRIQADRIERAEAIIACVEAETGVDLDCPPKAGIGRPHIARAIDESDAPYDYRAAFEELIGGGCRCYVPREVTPVDRGIDLLRDACRLVGLAHPLRYPDPERALEVTADLDAVERYYPYDETPHGTRTGRTELVDRAIERHDLLATGGSDAHDTTLGRAGPPAAAFERFRRRFEA
jgi:predicted metal-dependent phosphoesterase TrpH